MQIVVKWKKRMHWINTFLMTVFDFILFYNIGKGQRWIGWPRTRRHIIIEFNQISTYQRLVYGHWSITDRLQYYRLFYLRAYISDSGQRSSQTSSKKDKHWKCFLIKFINNFKLNHLCSIETRIDFIKYL